MYLLNIIIPVWIILVVGLIAGFFYLFVGGEILIVFGASTQFIGFWVSMFSQRTVRVKREEFEKLLEPHEKFNDIPYIQVGYHQWRFFMGWVIVSIGFFLQMIGLFLPEIGLIFQ